MADARADESDGPISDAEPLRDQIAVITGGGRGIGLGIARALARRGCRLVIASRNKEQVASAVESLEAAVGFPECDVRRAECIERLFEFVVERFGSLDILITSAGIARSPRSARHVPSPVSSYDEGCWDDVIDTNLRGVFLACRAAARLMVARRRGQIVNVSSLRAVQRGHAFGSAYCASKMAARALLEAMAAELAPHGIRVMSFMPDVVETSMIAATDLAKHGSLSIDEVGEYVAALLALPMDTSVEGAPLAPLTQRRQRKGADRTEASA